MSNSISSAAPAAAIDAAMADPTPPVPDTSTRVPLNRRPLRSTPRTKPAPSNWSPSRLPSGRLSTALQAPATRAVGVTSSTSDIVVTLCGIVTNAPRRFENLKICASDTA
ncbi:hypothetical protein D9M68_847840 [compost metagenome]